MAFPTHFDVGIFLFIGCVGVSQPVSGYLSERIVPCVTVDSVGAQEPPVLPSCTKTFLLPEDDQLDMGSDL